MLNFSNANRIFLLFLPISLILGNFALNLNIILINLVFIILLFDKKSNEFNFVNFFFKKKILINILAIVLILFILNLTYSKSYFLTLKGILGVLKNFICILALSVFFKTEKNFQIFLKMYTVIMLFLILDLIFQFLTGKDIFGYEFFKDNNDRLSGFFGYEYVAGAYISKSLFLIFLLNLGFIFQNKIKNIFNVIFIILIIIILFLVGERAAIVITIFSSFIYAFLIFDTLKSKIISLTFFSFLIVIITYFISINFQKKNIFLKTKEQFGIENNIYDAKIVFNHIGNSVYFNMFNTSLEIFRNNKVFGSGLRTFRFICQNTTIRDGENKKKGTCSTHPHNIYLEILSELGLILFSIFIFFHLFIFKVIITNLSQNKRFLLPLLCMGIVLFFPLQTTGSYFSSWNSFFYVIFYSIYLKYISRDIIKKT